MADRLIKEVSPGVVTYTDVITEDTGNISIEGDLNLIDSVFSYTNVLGEPLYLAGQTGLDDLTTSGTYSDTDSALFTILINSTGTPDTFDWRKGSGAWIEDVAMTGSAQLLSDGISVTWGATIGHTKKDQWIVGAGYRTRIDKPLSIAEITTVGDDLFIAGTVEAMGSINASGGIALANGDHSIMGGDIHFYPQSQAALQSLIFYSDPDQGSLEKLRIQWQENSGDGALSIVGPGNIFFENTDSDGVEFKISGGDDSFPSFYFANDGTNGGLGTISVGNRNPQNNVAPQSYCDIYFRDGGIDNNLYINVDGEIDDWRELAKYNADGTFSFPSDVDIAGDLSLDDGIAFTDADDSGVTISMPNTTNMRFGGSGSFADSQIVVWGNDSDGGNGGRLILKYGDEGSLWYYVNGVSANQTMTLDPDGNLVLNNGGDITTTGDITATTFLGDLNGTINTATTGVTQSSLDNSTLIATTAYVDTAVGGEDLWNRAGTTLSPNTVGDDISTTGDIYGGGATFTDDVELTGQLAINQNGAAILVQATTENSSTYFDFRDSTGATRGLFGVDGAGLSGAAGQFSIATWTDAPMVFFMNQVEKMRLTADGLTMKDGNDITIEGADLFIDTLTSPSTRSLYFRNSSDEIKAGLSFIDDGSDGSVDLMTSGPLDIMAAGGFAVNSTQLVIDAVTGDVSIGDGDLDVTGDVTLGSTTTNTVTVLGDIRAHSGETVEPSYSFAGDPDTGMYLGSGNELGFAIGGQDAIYIFETGIYIKLPLQGVDGTESAPSFSFESDPNTGMFRSGTDALGFTTGGTERMTLDSSGDLSLVSGDISANDATINSISTVNIVYFNATNASSVLPGWGTGTITLATETRYIGPNNHLDNPITITDTIHFSKKATLEDCSIGSSATIGVTVENEAWVELRDTAIGFSGTTLFSLADTGGTTQLDTCQFEFTGTGQTLFDMTAITDSAAVLLMDKTLIIGSGNYSLGIVDNVAIAFSFNNILFYDGGLSLQNNSFTEIRTVQMVGNNAVTTHLTFEGTTQGRIGISGFTSTIQANEYAFNFNPGTTFGGSVSVIGCIMSGVTDNVFEAGSYDQTTVGFKFTGNTWIPDSAANAYINALDQGGAQTLLDQDTVSRIAATFTEQGIERFSTDAAGTIEYLGNETLTASLLATITGTVSTGTNIPCSFYFAKGNSTNTILSFSDPGGGETIATTSSAHGYTTGDRIIIEDTASYNSEYLITVQSTTEFKFTEVYTSTDTGSHYKVQEFSKGSNTFTSTATKNTSMISQVPLIQNDQLFLCVENTGNSGEWETDDIQSIYIK